MAGTMIFKRSKPPDDQDNEDQDDESISTFQEYHGPPYEQDFNVSIYG